MLGVQPWKHQGLRVFRSPPSAPESGPSVSWSKMTIGVQQLHPHSSQQEKNRTKKDVSEDILMARLGHTVTPGWELAPGLLPP